MMELKKVRISSAEEFATATRGTYDETAQTFKVEGLLWPPVMEKPPKTSSPLDWLEGDTLCKFQLTIDALVAENDKSLQLNMYLQSVGGNWKEGTGTAVFSLAR